MTYSKEHLDMAVKIKLELQELSPSRRTNWKEHQRLMELAGFMDSGTDELYRVIVKAYQKRTGQLAPVQKYADMVSQGKLDAIKTAVGEMYIEKQDISKVKRELNSVKREISKAVLITDEVRNAFLDEIDFSFPSHIYNPLLPSQKNVAVVVITDWHIGATIHNNKGNSYNLEIAKKRIEKLKKEVMDYCSIFNINDVVVAVNGDMVEQVSMRNVNQSFEAEFGLGKQIVHATRLIADFVISLACHKNVEMFINAGNHDRFQSNKFDAIDGDNVMVVIAESVKTIIEFANSPRLKFLENEEFNYEFVKEVNGKLLKFVHGDFEKRMDKGKLEKHIAADEQIYDALIMGHFHYFEVIERNFGRLEIRVGSPMGRNFYSRKFKANSDPSQAILIVTPQEIIPIRIGLMEV